ncbi:uncharacterized protein TNCV_356801 [Trichonephila clavipes]|nr:uncharacterized protein TNCV_356801 [Trichonephila clavipes]
MDSYTRRYTAYNKKRCAAFPFETGIHFRRRTDFFPEEDTTKSYLGIEPTRLQAEGHSHHTGWATNLFLKLTSYGTVGRNFRYALPVTVSNKRSSPVPLKIRRVGQRCSLNLSRAETSSRWCGVVVRRGVPAQVSSTSLDHGSKLRGPSPKALV